MTTGRDTVNHLQGLLQDLATSKSNWKHGTSLDAYLETMHSWLRNQEVRKQEHPSWEFVCKLLKAPRDSE